MPIMAFQLQQELGEMWTKAGLLEWASLHADAGAAVDTTAILLL
jgi:hypothetical protein